ncbi:carbonic anhydrase [Botrimarina mediterranea]|uniref:carbonic anhydrase n=1 Tax=Botrimarina mediterranea TaxID=2528022 RepID=UPI003AF32767
MFIDPRSLIAFIVLFAIATLTGAQETSHPNTEILTAQQAIAELEQGNRRCVDGKSAHGHDAGRWRERFLVKQKPFAIVLGCSDSRVAPELLFDQGFGDLFVIRVAGNIVDDDVVGSIQYAVEHLDNKLIVVLGHQNCGAVTAALSSPDQARSEPQELSRLLDRIRLAIALVDREHESTQRLAEAVEANARASVKQLRNVPSIAKAIKEKGVEVVGAVYHIDSGKTTFLNE